MKPAVLCLLLISACTDFTESHNVHTYKLTWACQSPDGCERTEQVELIDRVEMIDDYDVIDFFSSRDQYFGEDAQMVPPDPRPGECTWLYGLGLFKHELEPSRFCRTSGRFELELSIPNREPTTHSEWLVTGRER